MHLCLLDSIGQELGLRSWIGKKTWLGREFSYLFHLCMWLLILILSNWHLWGHHWFAFRVSYEACLITCSLQSNHIITLTEPMSLFILDIQIYGVQIFLNLAVKFFLNLFWVCVVVKIVLISKLLTVSSRGTYQGWWQRLELLMILVFNWLPLLAIPYLLFIIDLNIDRLRIIQTTSFFDGLFPRVLKNRRFEFLNDRSFSRFWRLFSLQRFKTSRLRLNCCSHLVFVKVKVINYLVRPDLLLKRAIVLLMSRSFHRLRKLFIRALSIGWLLCRWPLLILPLWNLLHALWHPPERIGDAMLRIYVFHLLL